MKQVKVAALGAGTLRDLAHSVDQAAGVGNQNGVLTLNEVELALAAPAATFSASNRAHLQALRTLLAFAPDEPAAAEPSATPASGPMAARMANMAGPPPAPPALVLDNPQRPDVTCALFQVPGAQRKVLDRQPVLIPLDARELHVIELQYQDIRPLKDLEFNGCAAGSSAYKPFRGSEYFERLQGERAGTFKIQREPDHNGPWVNNPVKVNVEVLFPDGRIHHVGNKFLDFNVHDAHSVDGAGYPETDNISNGYEYLPDGPLPAGCLLRLTPHFTAKKPWEAQTNVAMDLRWVKPQYLPEHTDAVSVFSAGGFQDAPAEGFAVDPNRTIAAVLVTWSDNGGTASGSIRLDSTEQGAFTSPSSNVGSGESELIPVDRKALNGRIKLQGYGIQVSDVRVLYK
jgi:hypothetical protein